MRPIFSAFPFVPPFQQFHVTQQVANANFARIMIRRGGRLPIDQAAQRRVALLSIEAVKAGACDVGLGFRIRINLNTHYAIAWDHLQMPAV